jgi:hypothetical protein
LRHHEAKIVDSFIVGASPTVALGAVVAVVERDARADDVNDGGAAMTGKVGFAAVPLPVSVPFVIMLAPSH